MLRMMVVASSKKRQGVKASKERDDGGAID
jgi:hypothetical protein